MKHKGIFVCAMGLAIGLLVGCGGGDKESASDSGTQGGDGDTDGDAEADANVDCDKEGAKCIALCEAAQSEAECKTASARLTFPSDWADFVQGCEWKEFVESRVVYEDGGSACEFGEKAFLCLYEQHGENECDPDPPCGDAGADQGVRPTILYFKQGDKTFLSYDCFISATKVQFLDEDDVISGQPYYCVCDPASPLPHEP